LGAEIESLADQYTGSEPNIYPLIREFTRSISQSLEVMSAEISDQTNGAVNPKASEIIERNCRYAQLLLHNLLWFGVGVDLPQETVDVAGTLNTVRKIMASEIRERRDNEDDEAIDIRLEIQPNLPPVLGNRVNLQQIFMNLITNALEAMPTGGILTMRAFQKDTQVCAEVSDSGTGIAPQDLAKIFDLAFSTKQGRERGTGLHIVKSIVDKWDGAIKVVSELGLGTTFRVYLRSVDKILSLGETESHVIISRHINS
jgi:signal transduction histidine kinase